MLLLLMNCLFSTRCTYSWNHIQDHNSDRAALELLKHLTFCLKSLNKELMRLTSGKILIV